MNNKLNCTVVGLLLVLTMGWAAVEDTMIRRVNDLTRAELESVMEHLSHDLFEGRAPGTRGGFLVEQYLRSLCKFLGFQPGINGSFLQPFTLIGFTTGNLAMETPAGKYHYPDDLVGTYTGGSGPFSVSGRVLFVGFGISADRWAWDDFKNVDVRNRILICRVNDPGMFIPGIFEGKVLTYFGRWMYHIEEAVRRGALGILLIHTDETAGYSWTVVKNSWFGEELYLEKDVRNPLRLRAWIQESSLRRILSEQGFDLDHLYSLSLQRDFRPLDLGFRVTVTGTSRVRRLHANNVVATIPGQIGRHIVLSSHIDHHGFQPGVNGDGIFNGAIDNGSAVAAMMLTARILKEFQQELYYGVTVLACNAEEAGMLGSKFYVRNADRNGIVANINFESTPVWEEADSIMGVGARFSEFEPMLRRIAAGMGLSYTRFSMSNQGFFYRSDQFSFARYHIPAVWISAGENDRSGKRKYQRYWQEKYHTVADEFDPAWDLGGLRQTIRAALSLIMEINAMRRPPQWSDTVTFPWEGE